MLSENPQLNRILNFYYPPRNNGPTTRLLTVSIGGVLGKEQYVGNGEKRILSSTPLSLGEKRNKVIGIKMKRKVDNNNSFKNKYVSTQQ